MEPTLKSVLFPDCPVVADNRQFHAFNLVVDVLCLEDLHLPICLNRAYILDFIILSSLLLSPLVFVDNLLGDLELSLFHNVDFFCGLTFFEEILISDEV